MAAKARLIISYVALVFLAGHVWTKGKPPRLIIKPKREYNVPVGIKVRMKCVATGIDDPEENRTLVAWKKLGYGWIYPQKDPRYKLNKKGLRIVNVQPKDSGRYMCIAHNVHGFENATTTVNVRGKPTIPEYPLRRKISSDIPRSRPIDSLVPSHKPRRGRPPRFIGQSSTHQIKINLISGKSVKLKCKASGKPAPKITWHKNNRRLSRYKRRQHLTGKGWILAFDHLLMNDAGTYICRVRNKFGSISRIFNLRVAPNNNPAGKDNGIQVVLHNITVNEGDNATFVCKVIGPKKPAHVSWLKFNWNISAPASRNNNPDDYQLITQANHTLRQKLLTDKPVTLPGTKKRSFGNRLVLLHVKKEDEGMYTCTVGNKGGFQSTRAYLTVKRKPEGINFSSSGNQLQIRGEIPMAAFIGVPLAVATVLIASLVWCFAQTRKSKGKSSSQTSVPTLDTKLSLEMRSVTHERHNDYSSPATEQSRMRSDEQSRISSDEKSRMCTDEKSRMRSDEQSRMFSDETSRMCSGEQSLMRTDDQSCMCSDDATLQCDSRASCKCDKCSIGDEHPSSQHFNHQVSSSCDASTERENNHKQSAENESHGKGDEMRKLHHDLHIYKLPNLEKIGNETSLDSESKHTYHYPPCSCKTNSCFCNSSLTNSATIQSVV